MIKVKPEQELIKTGLQDFKRVSAEFLKQFSPTDRARDNTDLINFKNLVNLTSVTEYTRIFRQGNPTAFHQKLLQWLVSERFRRFMLAYAKAINKQEERTGSLFQKLFRRKHIIEAAYLTNAVLYIHRNSIHHNIALELTDWPWNSYESIISEKQTNLKRGEVLEWFGGLESFVSAQTKQIEEWENG